MQIKSGPTRGSDITDIKTSKLHIITN